MNAPRFLTKRVASIVMSGCEFVKSMMNPDLLIDKKMVGDIQRNIDAAHLQKIIEHNATYFDKHGEFDFTTPFHLGFTVPCRVHSTAFGSGGNANANPKCDCRTIDTTNFDQFIVGILLTLIDGGHRFEALRSFMENPKYKDANVNVEIHLHMLSLNRKWLDYEELFVKLNSNKPVAYLTNIPVFKNLLKTIDAHMRANYNEYIRNSDSPNFPNFNIDKMNAYIISRYISDDDMELLTPSVFLQEFDAYNIFIRNHHHEFLVKTKYERTAAAKVSAVDNNINLPKKLYLTIFREFQWFDVIINKMILNARGYPITYDKMQHYCKERREPIDNALRHNVWAKRCTAPLSCPCFICGTEMMYTAFQCGHITSVYKGGKSTLDNLEPVCGPCNRNVGVTNMIEYKNAVNK